MVTPPTKDSPCSWCGRTSQRRVGDHPRCIRERELSDRVMLHYGEEWTEMRIAKALGLTQQAVNVIVKRALEKGRAA